MANREGFGPQMKTARRRPRARFFVIIGATLAVVVVVLVFVLRGQPTAAVEEASTVFQDDFEMLIVRDEVVYEAKNYGQTRFVAVQGQHVEVGDLIVEVYEWGYNDETLSGLLDVQKAILTYEIEVSREGIIDDTLAEINTRIDSKAREIQRAVTGHSDAGVLGLERDMQALLAERMDYLKSVVVPDEPLRDLYAQEQVLLETIAGWRSEVSANEAGVVSFYFDGTEALMAKDNIGSFTAAALEEISAGKIIETPEHDQAFAPLYRVVDENEWYVVMHADERIAEMFIGNGFSLIFDDYLETQYTGVVVDATKLENNDGFVYTILIEDDIGPLLDKRRVSAKVYNEMKGLRVPASCVKSTDQVDYVETPEGEIIPVLIIADDGEYVFIQTYSGEKTLKIGQILKK